MASKRIIIAGGVAGGMSAAARARRLDESAVITVFERGPYTGYANCGIPYALGGVIAHESSLILRTPQGFMDRYKIDVQVEKEVTGINRTRHLVSVRDKQGKTQEVPYDNLILAQGAEPIRPPIKGLDQDHVFALQTIPDLTQVKARLAQGNIKRVCVIGAGFIGLEAVENLKELGLEVTVVERSPHVLPPLDADIAEIIHTELRDKGVRLFLSATAKSIVRDQVVLEDGREIPAEMVILVTGVRPRMELAKQAGLEVGKAGVKVNEYMQTSDPDIYAVGDMVETEHRIAGFPVVTTLAGPANRQGRMAADHIYGKTVQYRGNVGTAICRVFNQTVGMVGFSIETLRHLGRDPEWVTVHPPDHAGYYPGSHQLTLKVAFEKKTGKLLGAQGVGVAGIDKRIDVLATAMQAGMTVFDLEHLELAYAPPYGSAKDPVNMAGFVAGNMLRGDVKFIHPEDVHAKDLTNYQVLDVRSPGEFAQGHLPHAVNISIDVLRGRLGDLDRKKRTLVYCQVGYRGYLGYRILVQEGFDVVNLDGGFKSVLLGGFKELQAMPEAKI